MLTEEDWEDFDSYSLKNTFESLRTSFSVTTTNIDTSDQVRHVALLLLIVKLERAFYPLIASETAPAALVV